MVRELGFVHCPVCMLPHTDPPVEDGVWCCLRCGQEVEVDSDDEDDEDDW